VAAQAAQPGEVCKNVELADGDEVACPSLHRAVDGIDHGLLAALDAERSSSRVAVALIGGASADV
jgi:hypothetical protein